MEKPTVPIAAGGITCAEVEGKKYKVRREGGDDCAKVNYEAPSVWAMAKIDVLSIHLKINVGILRFTFSSRSFRNLR